MTFSGLEWLAAGFPYFMISWGAMGLFTMYLSRKEWRAAGSSNQGIFVNPLAYFLFYVTWPIWIHEAFKEAEYL